MLTALLSRTHNVLILHTLLLLQIVCIVDCVINISTMPLKCQHSMVPIHPQDMRRATQNAVEHMIKTSSPFLYSRHNINEMHNKTKHSSKYTFDLIEHNNNNNNNSHNNWFIIVIILLIHILFLLFPF